MIIQTYRRFTYQLTSGIDFLRSALGVAWSGTVALVQDALAEGARQSFIQGLPGHPEQTEDSLNQVGADRQMFRYRGESVSSWSARVRNAWQCYEQAGTAIQVVRAVNEWGAIVFPATWSTGAAIVEGSWARFTVFIHAGNLPWGTAPLVGSVLVGDFIVGVTGATVEDVSTLIRIVRKWKPLRSKGTVCVVLSGHVVGEPGLLVGGFNVGTGSAISLNC